LRKLNHFPAVKTIGERAEIYCEKQKRCPVAEHRESGQYRRFEFFVEQPVTDHVLDIVRHHGEHGGKKISAKVFVMQRGEGDLLRICSGGSIARNQYSLQNFYD